MKISTIEKINGLTRLEGGQNTLILNFGFGKCGSTSLQSTILPYLPLKNYTYQGRYYKLIIDSSRRIVSFRPVVKKERLINYIEQPELVVEKLIQIFKGQTNQVVCLSEELLPTNPDEVSNLFYLIKQSLSEVKIIYLFSIRDLIPMVISGYSHACIQHLKMKGFSYSINEVIFETFVDAQKAGYSNESLNEFGAKRPIIMENFYLAKMIENLKTNKSNTFILNVNSLFTNQQLWFELLLNITKEFDETYSIAEQWVQLLGELSPVNTKTQLAKMRIEKDKRSLNQINSNKLNLIDIENKITYCTLGHYWD